MLIQLKLEELRGYKVIPVLLHKFDLFFLSGSVCGGEGGRILVLDYCWAHVSEFSNYLINEIHVYNKLLFAFNLIRN